MKKYILLLILAVFTANLSAESFNTSVTYEMSDLTKKKPKKRKSHKAKRHAKKKGLVGHGCRGLKAMPKNRR
jgi:hypothetical protein